MQITKKFQIQLTITLAFIFLFGYQDDTRKFVIENILIILPVSVGITFFVLFTLICIESARKKWPINFILLTIFTISISCSVGMATLRLDRNDVIFSFH